MIDLDDCDVTAVAQLPGFTRGLALAREHAVLAVSRPHQDSDLDGLPLEERVPASDPRGWSGVFVVELGSGRIEHSLRFKAGSGQIQGLALLTGARSPDAVRYSGEDAQELVAVPDLGGPRRVW